MGNCTIPTNGTLAVDGVPNACSDFPSSPLGFFFAPYVWAFDLSSCYEVASGSRICDALGEEASTPNIILPSTPLVLDSGVPPGTRT